MERGAAFGPMSGAIDGEERYFALVPMSGRLYAVCYCVRGGARRIISFRKANKREEQGYAKAFG